MRYFLFILVPFNYLLSSEYISDQCTIPYNEITVCNLDVSDTGTITDLDIEIDLDHNYDDGLSYVSLMLLSPTGTSILLAAGEHAGGSWNNSSNSQLFNTIFDDF